jgi:alkylation response protein AidB-like acyl-CoA dehydrogenase
MDIKLNEDQIEIARQARRFCENESSMDYVRAMFADDRGFTDQFWAKQAEMGWLAMGVPEAYGGLDMPLMDLAVVLEEMGRALVPGPFFSTALLAAKAVSAAGNDSQKQTYLSAMAAGEMKSTLALHEPDGGADPAYIQMFARPDGDGYVLEGTKIPVPDAHVADVILCAARTTAGSAPEKGVTLFLVDPRTEGLSISRLPTMDGTRKLCAVTFKAVRVNVGSVLGEVNGGWAPLERVVRCAQVGLCADSVGGANKAMEIATEYAKERVQFDQPIGAFQAIKHRCAQMYVEVESARSLLYWAAWAQDNEAPEAALLAASVAKAYCSEVYRNVTTGAIQVLGGTGFSWEHDIHLYLKRAKANEAMLGDPVYHREQVARLITAI